VNNPLLGKVNRIRWVTRVVCFSWPGRVKGVGVLLDLMK
jgi:hypothetical protein